MSKSQTRRSSYHESRRSLTPVGWPKTVVFPSSSALHQDKVCSRSTIALDVAFAHCTLESKHQDRLAARRLNGTPFCGTRHGKIQISFVLGLLGLVQGVLV